MAAMGFFFLLNVKVLDNSSDFSKAVTMLRKLQGDDGVYDASALLLADFSGEGNVVSPKNTEVPDALSTPRFFERIIDTALVRGPMSAHQLALDKAPITIVGISE